jgi:subtilisin family serine protease
VSVFPRVYDLYELDAPLPGGEPNGDPRACQTLPFAAVRAGDPAPAASFISVLERYPRDRLSLLLGLDHVIGQHVDVINCSLGFVGVFDAAEPIARATRAAVQAGCCVVVAAGNEGPDLESMQQLARAPWVVSVGSTTPDGVPLKTSGRGSPEVKGPTVVADGTDYYQPPIKMLVDFTKLQEDGEPTITRPVPTMEPGTSFATPVVSRELAFVRKVLETAANLLTACAAGDNDQPADPVGLPVIALLDTGYDPDFAAVGELGPWRRKARDSGWTHIQLTHTDEERAWCRAVVQATGGPLPPVTVETLHRSLPLMTTPVAGDPWVVGAGLVSGESATAFATSLTPSRLVGVLAASAPDPLVASALADLDASLGPIWSEHRVDTFRDLYRTGQRISVCRVA